MDRNGIPRKWSRKARELLDPQGTKEITFERFLDMFSSIPHHDVLSKALLGTLIIPEFHAMTEMV